MEYNPFLPEVQANPFPYYAELRHDAPLYQVPGVGFWAVSRYDDVFYALKNPQVFSSAGFVSAFMGDLDPFPPEARAIIDYDPPDHIRLRKLVNRAFTPRRVASLETHIHEVTHHLVEQIPAQGAFDLVQGLSAPLPVIVIAELLGVPPERRDDFKGWVDNMLPASNQAVPPQAVPAFRRSVSEFFAYFGEALAAYRKEPRDNLLSDLVRAEEEQQMLSPAEVLSLAIFLIMAGSETTTNLIANAMLALCTHPEQLAKVRANPALIPNLVEEALRYDGPIQMLARKTTQEVELSGGTIPAESVVMLLLGSANRDEQKFPEPDRFDILRNTEGHVGFGFGIHFCLGAQLARLEAKAALETVLRRFPHLACTTEQVTRIGSIIVRGLKTLPLMVS